MLSSKSKRADLSRVGRIALLLHAPGRQTSSITRTLTNSSLKAHLDNGLFLCYTLPYLDFDEDVGSPHVFC
jgi:hypothetical protein